MRVEKILDYNVAIMSSEELLEKHFANEKVDLEKCAWVGGKPVVKSETNQTVVHPPLSMYKLLHLAEVDEYHNGCIDAQIMGTIMDFSTSNKQFEKWMEDAVFPENQDMEQLLEEFLRYYLECGNGFLLKMRNSAGEWVGLERMLPTEVVILENYDEYGFYSPDYLQIKNYKKKFFPGKDVIHLKNPTYRSNAWGLSCLPIITNIAILEQIKIFDHNNFNNGLLIDYFIIVEGGTLKDDTIEDNEGNEVMRDAYTVIKEALQSAKGNTNSHNTVLIETENKDTHIRLEPMRQQDKDGGFLKLKKDLREGIFAYHRTPPRVVSQLVAGQLGGDGNSDMILFYNFVIKPLQSRLKKLLAREFSQEGNITLSHKELEFGDLTTIFLSEDEKIFNENKN